MNPLSVRIIVLLSFICYAISLVLVSAELQAAFQSELRATADPQPPGLRQPLPELFYRRYSEQTFIGTHNSPALRTRENGWSLSGNQYFNLSIQVASGIRLIQAQGHRDPNGTTAIRLCHFNCALIDGGSLEDYLLIAKAWLEENPHEVITFLFVNTGVPLSHWASAFFRTGFDLLSFTAPRAKRGGRMHIEDWPTVEEMVRNGKRAVTFLSAGANERLVPWILPEFDYVFEASLTLLNPSPFQYTRLPKSQILDPGLTMPTALSTQTDFGNEHSSQFSCAPSRPSYPGSFIPNRLSLVNHFLYAKFFGFRYPDAAHANRTNGAGFHEGELGEHAARCRTRYERRPNFLLVDFFSEGRVWDVEYGMNAF